MTSASPQPKTRPLPVCDAIAGLPYFLSRACCSKRFNLSTLQGDGNTYSVMNISRSTELQFQNTLRPLWESPLIYRLIGFVPFMLALFLDFALSVQAILSAYTSQEMLPAPTLNRIS